MKSSFLLVLLLASLISHSSLAQSNSTPDGKATEEKSSFDKFYERVRINYFGAYTGSSVGHWDERAMDEKAVRSEGYVHNLWNQLSFGINFGTRMNFVINPRWTLNTGSTSGHDPDTRGLFLLEDTLVGFQGVAISSADKKFNWWTRPGIRLPNSRFSRQVDITTQPEVLSFYTYDFNPTWQLGLMQQIRFWVYEQRYNTDRYRIFNAPFVQYTLDDKNRIQLYWEHFLEQRAHAGGNRALINYWQNFMLAWSTDVTPKFNLMPFIGYVNNAHNIPTYPLDPMWLGAWISYTFK